MHAAGAAPYTRVAHRAPHAIDAYPFGNVLYAALSLRMPWEALPAELRALFKDLNAAKNARTDAERAAWEVRAARARARARTRPGNLSSLIAEWAAVQRGERQHALPTEAAAAAPEGFVALLRELWAHDPARRPTFAETLRRLRARGAAEAAATEREALKAAMSARDTERKAEIESLSQQLKEQAQQQNRSSACSLQ